MKSLSDTSTFYGESEASLVAFLADTLIPRTDTPGAIDAGVPQLMDQLYREWASVSTPRVQALQELEAAAFSNGAHASELADYRAVKSLILDSYYSTEADGVPSLPDGVFQPAWDLTTATRQAPAVVDSQYVCVWGNVAE